MKKYILFIGWFVSSFLGYSQDNLLDELESTVPNNSFKQPAFKAMKIGNLQSTKIAHKGDLYMNVSHRFGSVSDGLSTFFGLDNAVTKIQLVYGLTDFFQLGVSRESLRKTYATSFKAVLMRESNKFPLNITAYSTINYNTAISSDRYPLLKKEDRLSYATQLLISKTIANRLSLQIAPTFVRQNLVLEPFQDHEQYALGIGGRFKLTNRWSFNADYVENFSRAKQSLYKNALTVGTDIETGGHVFQLLFSNAQSANEPGFISNAEGDWSKGEVYFGFNIVRVF